MSFRKDHTARGGGLLTYVTSDLPTSQRPDLELQHVENITIETTVCAHKLAIICVYRPPSMPNATFIDDFSTCIDKVHVHFTGIVGCFALYPPNLLLNTTSRAHSVKQVKHADIASPHKSTTSCGCEEIIRSLNLLHYISSAQSYSVKNSSNNRLSKTFRLC